ncbi:MAG: cation transporter [Candidatus Omnitrophica bacterium]|nr:cation transporter [Candidatus Omnitrophota bacterium]
MNKEIKKIKNRAKCEKCAQRTSWVGLVSGFFLASFKLVIGFLGGSRALMGSGMCNLSDISSSIIVMLGVKYSRKGANKKYHYGYGKVESIAQVAIGALMMLGNIVLIFSSFVVIARSTVSIPHMVVFVTAIISAIVNGLIYKFALCGAKELNSPALMSHAEHNKVDVVSSVLVAVGVLAARIGLHWADPVIAIFEAIHVVHGSWVIFWDGFKGLMDTSVPAEYIDDIRERVYEIEGVKKVAKVKARQSGQMFYLDISVTVDPSMSVMDSKDLVQMIRKHLKDRDRYIGSILVQVVPAGLTVAG